MVCRRGNNITHQLTPTSRGSGVKGFKLKRRHLWNSSLEQVVFHREGGCVHRGHDQHGNIWMTPRTECEVEGDANPAAIEQSDGLKVT